MGETNSVRGNSSKRAAMESLSLEINRYPRDLLTRFLSSNACTTLKDEDFEADADEEAVELSLGLSLGGRFGVDKTSQRKLTRSSSIAGSIPFLRQHELSSNESPPPVTRTSSLPTETQEEWRKRKEIQSLRRMEAKRRRCEKQRNLKGELSLEDVDLSRGNWVASSRGRPRGVGVNASKGCSFHGFMSGIGYGADCGSSRSASHRQGSQESQGGGSSSGVSEFESKQIQGSVSGGETRSSSSFHSLQDRTNQDSVGSSGTKPTENTPRNSRPQMENPSKKLVSTKSSEEEVATKSLEDMPCVFTVGEGPNGRKVEGILYKYGRGEEVTIMCICHGSFLSPAEFVKHAGGGDVAHPLRRIVVNPLGVPFL